MKGQAKIDEFGFVLFGGVVLLFMLLLIFSTPQEPLPKLEPNEIKISMARGEIKFFEVKIIGRSTSTRLTAEGEISNFVKFSKNDFDVVERGSFTIIFSVPKNAEPRIWTGRIVVESLGGTQFIPVEIEVLEIALEEERIVEKEIFIGSFRVEFSFGKEVLDSKENQEVFKNYVSSKSFNLIFEIPKENLDKIEDPKIVLKIEETNKYGNLIIFFNDKKIFDKVAEGIIEIDVPKDLIKEKNLIKIEAGLPGIRFWASTVYIIERAEFQASFIGIFKKEIEFELTDFEKNSFIGFNLKFKVKEFSKPLKELIIRFNDQILFSSLPPLEIFDKSFFSDIFNLPLRAENKNRIILEFEEEAFYEVENALLTLFFLVKA